MKNLSNLMRRLEALEKKHGPEEQPILFVFKNEDGSFQNSNTGKIYPADFDFGKVHVFEYALHERIATTSATASEGF